MIYTGTEIFGCGGLDIYSNKENENMGENTSSHTPYSELYTAHQELLASYENLSEENLAIRSEMTSLNAKLEKYKLVVHAIETLCGKKIIEE